MQPTSNATVKQKAIKQHAKPAQKTSWLVRLSFLGSWLLVMAALVVCGMGITAVLHRLKNTPAAQVQVVGNNLSAYEQHLLYTQLQPLVKKGYFQADLNVLQQAASQQAWVDTVQVTRRWPNGIVVRVSPKLAVARWGSVRVLAANGTVFSESERRDHSDLVQIYGPESQSVVLMKLYQNVNRWFVPLGFRLNAIYFTDRLTCIMQFDTGLRIIVDQDHTLEKLQQLAVLAHGELNPAMPKLASIDLRYRNGFAVQWKAGQRPALVAGKLVYPAL